MVIDPREFGLPIDRQPAVALTVATSAVGAILGRYPTCPAGVRWPNDVEAGGRKLGGILTERVETTEGARLLVGVGLNVRSSLDDAPDEVRAMAASLSEWAEADSEGSINDLLADLLAILPDSLRALASAEPALVARWNRLDTLAGTTVRVAIGTEVIEGVADGIDNSGGLRLRVEGRIRILHAGRVLRDLAGFAESRRPIR